MSFSTAKKVRVVVIYKSIGKKRLVINSWRWLVEGEKKKEIVLGNLLVSLRVSLAGCLRFLGSMFS